MNVIQLLRIGDVDAEMLADLRQGLAAEFRVPCAILPDSLDPAFAFHAERQQYHTTQILGRMRGWLGAHTWRLLGVTAADLYIPILTFVFGEAQLGDACAVVSFHRLRQEFYGLPHDAVLLRERLRKEAMHELGHTFELTHCEDCRCAMAPSHAVEWIDIKGRTFCEACWARVAANNAFEQQSWRVTR